MKKQMNRHILRAGALACCAVVLVPWSAAQNPTPSEPLDITHAQYKRIHRHALHAIDTGRAAEAADQLLKYAEAHPDDAETHYALAVAYTKLDRLDDAWAAVRNAVELGLPPARFIAGPRNWLTNLLEQPEFQSFVRSHENQIVHGPLLGSLSDRGWPFGCEQGCQAA
jgi:tetratricopeptide (TPR) repeat protein